MPNPAIATPTPPASDDMQRRLGRLARVVQELRALERSRDGVSARNGALSDAVRAWQHEATATRRRLTGSSRLTLTPTPISKEHSDEPDHDPLAAVR